MKVQLNEIPVKDLVSNYINNAENGVIGYNNLLNIRPKYQREFVYKDKQRDAVIDTLRKDFPLNVMYWVKNKDNKFEVLDGQQRTISICEYVSGKFSLNYQYFHNLDQEEKDQILNYKLMVYFCEGSNREKLDWFKTINIAGEKLTDQELLNAVYTGSWLSDAKRYFSKPNCAAYNIASDYIIGSPIRQDYLETVLDWISDNNIEKYMSNNQIKPNATELWLYFNSVINWVKSVFPNYRKEMKGINWGKFYNQYKSKSFDFNTIETEIVELMQDEDVSKKSGIYPYMLTNNEKYLNIRSFSNKQKREVFEKQNGICTKCNGEFKINEMEGDHIIPWSKGGKTIIDNLQMLCKNCNRIKSNI